MIDIVSQYRLRASEFAKANGVDSPHIISIIASVMMTRDGEGIKGGGFVQSVVDNDLYQALSRADSECFENLKTIVAARQFCFLN